MRETNDNNTIMGVGSKYIHTWMCRYYMGNSIIYDWITSQFIKGFYNGNNRE